MKFAVIGGEARIVRLCSLLIEDGHQVRAFALEKAPLPPEVSIPASAAEAFDGAECAVLPLPCEVGGALNAPFAEERHSASEILNAAPPGALVSAGKAGAALKTLAGTRGLRLVDYAEREDFQMKNAVATAEGALALLISGMERTLWESRILIIGAGRIGTILAERLRGLGAEAWVSSRRAGDMARCRALGLKAADTRALKGCLGGFDAVINTVPAGVLGESALREIKPGAPLIELASAPGGFDTRTAEKLGLKAIQAPGLPGKTAPESAAEYIKEAIYSILEEDQS